MNSCHISQADYCTLPHDKGNCSETFYRYFFSPEHSKCLMFLYGGCGGNRNNFENLYSCMRKCSGKYPDEEEEITEASIPLEGNSNDNETKNMYVWNLHNVICFFPTVNEFLGYS